MIETRPILIENNAGARSAGTLRVRRYADGERWLRALKLLGGMWLVAAATVFIPIAHFVLVPGFLLAGPVMAVLRFRVGETLEAALGACPTCGRDIEVALDPAARLPLWTYCSPSNDPIHLRAVDGPAG